MSRFLLCIYSQGNIINQYALFGLAKNNGYSCFVLILKKDDIELSGSEIQYRSKVRTHFFSFFKTAVEIEPVG